jgi:hypothetical protein
MKKMASGIICRKHGGGENENGDLVENGGEKPRHGGAGAASAAAWRNGGGE